MATRVSSARLVGRTTELGELRDALAEARSGRPVIAFVAGESGVGKTRLLAELASDAAGQGVRVLHGDCVELGEGELPYAPITAALRPLVRDEDPVLDALSPGARHALPSLLPGLATDGGRRRSAIEAEGARAQVFEALLELLERLAADNGLLVAIEDLHWADSSTRAFLRFLAASLHDERVLVTATFRADELHRRHPLRPLLAELERAPCTRRIELAPLTRTELAEQLTDIAGAAPQPALLDRLWTRSEGNPLFAEELLAAGLDGRGALPPTLRDALMLRIDRLSPAAQEVARLLAVGRRLDHETLATVAGADPVALRDGLREAVSSQIVVVDPDGRYAFRHALLREVVLDDLLPGERADAHARLAGAIEARGAASAEDLVAVAGHFAGAGDRPAALRTAVAAGRASEAVHAYLEAAAHYERALALWDQVPDAQAVAAIGRVPLLRAAAYCRRTVNEPARAAALLSAAAAGIDAQAEPDEAASVLERLAAVQWMQGLWEDSDRTRARAHGLLGDGDEPRPARARLWATESKQLMLAARYRESVEIARRALAEARACGERLAEVTALDSLGVSLASTGAHDEGLGNLRQAIELARAEDLPMTMLTAYTNLADAATIAGRLADGRRFAAEALAEGRAIGYVSRWLDLLQAELALLAGDVAAASASLPEHAHPAMGNTWHNDVQRRVDLALVLGDHDRARELLAAVAGSIADSREPQFIGPHAVARAELARRAGDLVDARRVVDEGLDRIEFCSEDRARVAHVAATGVRVEADAALRARDLADADAEALAETRAQDLQARVAAVAEDEQPVERARALGSRAAALRAGGADDPLTWERAAQAWDALGWRHEAALARLGASEAALAGGDRDSAATIAVVVRDEAAAMGAAWLLAEVEGLAARARLRLDAAAGPDTAPAAPPHADPFGLTARERQVLMLVAAGRTNREIGGELFMAEKTASVHVSRILAKLEVRSRTEAAGVAHRLGLA